MTRQIIFLITVLITLGVFYYTINNLIRYFKITRPAFPIRDFGKRMVLVLKVAFGQTKIFRRPVVGLFHALVFWGFCVILIGSIEMIIDGLTGTDKILHFLGPVYDFIMASGDIFALVVAVMVIIFLIRRNLLYIKRFEGHEMKKRSHVDANISLVLIFLLMLSLMTMNTGYLGYRAAVGEELYGVYPVGKIFSSLFEGYSTENMWLMFEISWWTHILIIFIFANYLPYSKHFHVFMSVPNVFLSRLDPAGKMTNMDSITREVKMIVNPSATVETDGTEEAPERFGVKDAEDSSWKNYFDSLSCTECGRCTSVCPANITGKLLSPRKVMMDLRARMKDKGPLMVKNGRDYNDNRSLLRDYITEEEIWACTTCNACVQECPVNINQPELILSMRRYLVLEEGSASAEIKAMFNNTENNGAPWQYSSEDRMLWARDMEEEVPVMRDLHSRGEKPEYLFWVGCAGAFDDRYKKVARAFARILSYMKIKYAVLGTEETCTGDPARRAGNEMLFQMQAIRLIDTLNSYGITKIITLCPHCFNTLKNEYPDLGGNYQVINYLQFLNKSISEGKLKLDPLKLNNISVTYHDPCYLGRANNIYDEPRNVIKGLSANFKEMPRNHSRALCCGAGGSQMFKEAEKGDKEIFIERTEEALKTETSVIATACPFCMTMITDGLKYKNKEEKIMNLDIAELVSQALGL